MKDPDGHREPGTPDSDGRDAASGDGRDAASGDGRDAASGDGRDAPDARGIEYLEADLRATERKVAAEIDPGARAVVVAIAVLVAIGSLILPHTGHANAIDVLTYSREAQFERVTIVSRVFVYLMVIFGIGFSVLALLTRRWVLAWVALSGSAVGCVAGMLAWWSRNTPGLNGIAPPSGVGAGLVAGWLALFVITFHWARVVWKRTNYHLAVESRRREEAKVVEERARTLQRRANDPRNR